MSVSKVLGLGSAVIFISGCQSWQFRDIERLPPTASIPQESEPGKVDVWYFDGISGTTVDALTSSPAYPDSPDEITELTELENLQNRANNYGTLIRGFIEAPQTGEYTFYVAGDDETQFWLSDSEKPDSASQIATTGRATPIRDYNQYTSQTSPSMYLEAGRRYYFELRHKEGGWDDHFSVAWEGPGISRQVVSGDQLHSWAPRLPTTDQEMTSENAYEMGYTAGFIGQYFQGTSFDDFLYTRKDPSIQFGWGSGSPSPQVPNNQFSIRWQGWFVPPHRDGTRSYQLTTRTDDGVRLFVNGKLVIDQWKNQSATSYSHEISLEPEERVAITMEYYEGGWSASAAFTVTDQQTGTELSASNVIESLDLSTSPEVSTLEDGITDIYKLRYGLPLLQPSAGMVLNNEGITVLDAYQSGLHPYTLETVSEPDTSTTPAPMEPDASTVTLKWSAPDTRADGSNISLSEISHYEINYGQSPDKLDQEVRAESTATEYTLEGLAEGSWYFTIRAIDTDGLASQASNTVEFLVQ